MLSVVALVASGASPVVAQVPDLGHRHRAGDARAAGGDRPSTPRAASTSTPVRVSGSGTQVSVFDAGATSANAVTYPDRGVWAHATSPIKPGTAEVFVANYTAEQRLSCTSRRGPLTPNLANTVRRPRADAGSHCHSAGNLLVSSVVGQRASTCSTVTQLPPRASPSARADGSAARPGSPSYPVTEASVYVFDHRASTAGRGRTTGSASGCPVPGRPHAVRPSPRRASASSDRAGVRVECSRQGAWSRPSPAGPSRRCRERLARGWTARGAWRSARSAARSYVS